MHDGEYVPLEFKVETPYDRAFLDERMAANEARGLKEAVRMKTALIVSSGPSARDGAFLKAKADVTVAVNGALSLFTKYGRAPDFWACCDPQEEEVMRFVEGPLPRHTTYLLASKCPPALFDYLLSKDLDVRIWRLDDMNQTPGTLHVPTAVSITLVTQGLMRFMGYHRFVHYGWDCCYIDGEHHASSQPEPSQPIDFEIQDEQGNVISNFKTCGSWAAELRDAMMQAYNFKVMGYSVHVHGPGAVGALLRARQLIG